MTHHHRSDNQYIYYIRFSRSFPASNSDLLLKVSVKGFPLERCNSVYRVHNVVLGPTQLCAGGDKGSNSICMSDIIVI